MPPFKLYAEVPALRTRQLLLDIAVLVRVVAWVRIGVWLNDLVEQLGGPGRSMAEAGHRIAGWRAPLLRRELGPITSGGESLIRAGESQQEVVQTLALWLGVVVAALPIAWMLVRYMPGRLRRAQEMAAASSIREDPAAVQLFALRALARRSLRELRRADPDPVGAYGRGDYGALAALELSDLGFRPRPEGGARYPYHP